MIRWSESRRTVSSSCSAVTVSRPSFFRFEMRAQVRYLLAASMKDLWCSAVKSGSGRSRKNCFSKPVTLLTSWKKFSGFRKSSSGFEESTTC